jgi:glutamate-1-semialdehyde 2,1-aminomutase
MILEPVMMNAGIILPAPGYLDAIRDIVHASGALLAFDEVKTGLTVGPGGATVLFGVKPDIVCLAKAIGGGVSTAAIGGTAEVMGLIATGDYEQVGTFNGNPLAMAAARATLTEVLTDHAYEHFARLRERMAGGCEEVIERWRLPAHVVALGAKGCIVFSPDPVRNYREFLEVEDRYSDAHWLYQMNRGVFLPLSGKAEQWMLSVQHTDEDADRFVENFRAFAKALRS